MSCLHVRLMPIRINLKLLAAQIETIRVNVLGMLNLADICFQKNLHLTTYATGVACMPSLLP